MLKGTGVVYVAPLPMFPPPSLRLWRRNYSRRIKQYFLGFLTPMVHFFVFCSNNPSLYHGVPIFSAVCTTFTALTLQIVHPKREGEGGRERQQQQ